MPVTVKIRRFYKAFQKDFAMPLRSKEGFIAVRAWLLIF
jgi:hypothetical protein